MGALHGVATSLAPASGERPGAAWLTLADDERAGQPSSRPMAGNGWYDVPGLLLYLASPDAGFFSGAAVAMDGAWSAR